MIKLLLTVVLLTHSISNAMRESHPTKQKGGRIFHSDEKEISPDGKITSANKGIRSDSREFSTNGNGASRDKIIHASLPDKVAKERMAKRKCYINNLEKRLRWVTRACQKEKFEDMVKRDSACASPPCENIREATYSECAEDHHYLIDVVGIPLCPYMVDYINGINLQGITYDVCCTYGSDFY